MMENKKKKKNRLAMEEEEEEKPTMKKKRRRGLETPIEMKTKKQMKKRMLIKRGSNRLDFTPEVQITRVD